MNGRNADQIVRQRRQHRARRLAVATVFHKKKTHRRNQMLRHRGQLLAAQGTGEWLSHLSSFGRASIYGHLHNSCILLTIFLFFCFLLLYPLQMKTVSVALVLCLNVGVDPPDIFKIQPCARLECWIGTTHHHVAMIMVSDFNF